jgi:hypothetical protein
MKTLLHPLFMGCLILWISNQLLELNNIYFSPLYSYLDDLLCFPLILTFILAVQRSYFNNDNITIPISHIVFAVAAFIICFELLLPSFSDKYTADVLDVIVYGIGSFAFFKFINKPFASVTSK